MKLDLAKLLALKVPGAGAAKLGHGEVVAAGVRGTKISSQNRYD